GAEEPGRPHAAPALRGAGIPLRATRPGRDRGGAGPAVPAPPRLTPSPATRRCYAPAKGGVINGLGDEHEAPYRRRGTGRDRPAVVGLQHPRTRTGTRARLRVAATAQPPGRGA